MSDPATTHPVCQICGAPIDGTPHMCPSCETPHHDDCWEFNKGCSTYGCDQKYKGLLASQHAEPRDPMRIRAGVPAPTPTPTWPPEHPPGWTDEDEERLLRRQARRATPAERTFFLGCAAAIFIFFGVMGYIVYQDNQQAEVIAHNRDHLKHNIKLLQHTFHTIQIGDPARDCWSKIGINAVYTPESGSNVYEKGRFTYPKGKNSGWEVTQLVVYIFDSQVVGVSIIQPNNPNESERVHQHDGMDYYTWKDLALPRRQTKRKTKR